jgi:hypothetical protein
MHWSIGYILVCPLVRVAIKPTVTASEHSFTYLEDQVELMFVNVVKNIQSIICQVGSCQFARKEPWRPASTE